jgi:hypothetical protein
VKVTIDIDCTPTEARTFFGLPDLQPLQEAVLAEAQKRMLAQMDRFAPEEMLKTWFSLMPQGAEKLQAMVAPLFGGPGTRNEP